MPPRRENSAVDSLVDALRYEIMTGTLKSGQRIDLDEWAERMGASRTPVRQALERLETEGFVNLSGRRGATIIDVTIAHIEDVLASRLVLDAALGRAGAANLTPEHLQQLETLLLDIEAVDLPKDHALMVEPAQRFSDVLFSAAGAPMMRRFEKQSVHHTTVFLSSMWFTNRRIAYVGKAYFRGLFEACRRGDLDAVERLIREYRIDMAGVILQDRVQTDQLHILPAVLDVRELERLQAIVDHGEDPVVPEITSRQPPRRHAKGSQQGGRRRSTAVASRG